MEERVTEPESIRVPWGWAIWLVLVSVTFITLTFYNKAAARDYHDQVCVLRLAAAATEMMQQLTGGMNLPGLEGLLG